MMSALGVLLLLALGAADALADQRRYTYTYESTTMPKGGWEYEQWITWKRYDNKDRIDFRHEFEFGITDRFQAALYVVDWRWERKEGGETRTTYQDTAVELIYNLTDPIEDLVGSALYGEVKLGDEKFVLEGKVILEKQFGPINAAYNFVFEAEWEGSHYEEKKGEIKNTAGISYQFNPNFSMGVEMFHEFEIDDWSDRGSDAFYIGPNISYRKGPIWATVAAVWQATSVDGEADSQLRGLIGWMF